MRGDTFFGRVFLTIAALVSTALVVAAVLGEFKLRTIIQSDLAERRRIACDLLADPATLVLKGSGDLDAFAAGLRAVGALDGLRLTLIRSDGVVLADSEVQGPLANHAERPEVLSARQQGRGEARRTSTTTGKVMDYTTRQLKQDGVDLGTLRAATELQQVDAMVGEMRAGMLWFGAGALLLGLMVSALAAHWLAQPLKSVEGEAAALSAGNLEGTVHTDGPLEVRRLGETLNAMSRELRTRLEGQRRARVQIETILASMAEGVVAVDRSERVLLMNRAASELLGLPAPSETGALLWERLRFPDLERALRDALAGKGPWHGDAVSPLAHGRTLAISVAPVAAGAGVDGPDSQGAVALLSDVTAIRRLEQVRIDFVANVSHELRTPLAAVMGALETLGGAEQDPAIRERFLDIANRNAARLQAIVVDLLDLSSIEAQGDRMPLDMVRVESPLRTAASALSGEAESKGVKLEMPPPLAHPTLVRGNAQRLEQVFTNLLENALKYTPRGGRVRVLVRPGAREVSIDIEDTGVGIPESDLTRVFERFYRVDRSRSRDMGGTGLGLAIVKHVVRAHAGQVTVKSQEGLGSTFTVTLPVYGESGKSTFLNDRGHMSKQIREDLTDITKKIQHIGGLVEAAIDKSLSALLDRNARAAREVIEGDSLVDNLENEVEEKCLEVLATRQPVARDLRFICGMMKVNSDLERMADLAVNIAERAEVLAEVPPLPFRPDVSRMAAVAKRMVREGLDALVRRDADLALRVWKSDVEADRLYRELIGEAIQFMREHPDRIGDVMHLVGALRNLERLADHATNIAEDVIFVTSGRIVRHHMVEFSREASGAAEETA